MESTFAGMSVLVTGANRGLGQALVEEALRRGSQRVYAGARQPFSHPDPRVTPMVLDVTDETQIQQVVEQVESLDVLSSFRRSPSATPRSPGRTSTAT
jgi:NAD(P)-dependent dehydrogenase (short-subunit alcohol dehydrogenase family)